MTRITASPEIQRHAPANAPKLVGSSRSLLATIKVTTGDLTLEGHKPKKKEI
jgi:hypothetical protein